MITTEEIATRVYQMLQESEVKTMISGVIDYERNDYTKEDVIIVPHTIDGEGSVRFGQININIHVPDIAKPMGKGKSVHRINFPRLIEIRAKVIEVLQNPHPGSDFAGRDHGDRGKGIRILRAAFPLRAAGKPDADRSGCF